MPLPWSFSYLSGTGSYPALILNHTPHSTISAEHFRAYSSTLPHCWPLRTAPPVLQNSASHVRLQRRFTAPLCSKLSARLPPLCRFLGVEIPKHLLTHGYSYKRIARPARSWLSKTYPDACSAHALTGLSCTAICSGCPTQYQHIQISPQCPDASRRPQQPTCRDCVVPSRAPHNRDFHPFVTVRGCHVTMSPVSVSPNINT